MVLSRFWNITGHILLKKFHAARQKMHLNPLACALLSSRTMKSTSLKLVVLSLFSLILLGCAATQPAGQSTASASQDSPRDPLNKKGNGLASYMH
jgi:hypothetical protein